MVNANKYYWSSQAHNPPFNKSTAPLEARSSLLESGDSRGRVSPMSEEGDQGTGAPTRLLLEVQLSNATDWGAKRTVLWENIEINEKIYLYTYL